MDKVRKYKSLYSSICNTFAIGEGETITPASVTGLPQDTEITLTFDRVDSAGNKTPAKMERIRGKIVGGNFVISQGGRGADGTTEQVHTAPVVEMIWNADDWNDTVDHILTEHNQDGTHKDTLVTSLKATGAEINTGTEDAKIVTPKAIADSKLVDFIRGDGWISANETWQFVSVDDPTGVIKVNADVTSKYSVGMRLKMTNNSNVIYGIITKMGTYGGDSAGYTYITFLHEIDPSDSLALHLMANSAITLNYYSTQKAPQGFPLDPEKWSVTYSSTSTSITAITTFSTSGFSISVPIGVFNVDYLISLMAVGSGGEATFVQTALGKTSTPLSGSQDLKDARDGAANVTKCGGIFKGSALVTNTTKTTVYILAAYANSLGNVSIAAYHENFPTIIRAICAYL